MFRVRFSLVGHYDPSINCDEVLMNDIPRVGDTVDIPGVPETLTNVRTVIWSPYDPEGQSVYIVIGPRRI